MTDKINKREYIFVFLIVLLGVFLRAICLKNFGEIWYDELFSWYFASKESAFDTMRELLSYDIHMPLYFVLLHFWIKIFGDTADTMRILSIIVSCLFLPLSYILSKKLFNKTTAYYALIFFSINTFCIYYSVEIRFYSLVLLFSLLSAYFYTRALEGFRNFHIFGYIISVSVLFYTFSVTPLLILSNFIFGFLYLISQRREKILNFLLWHFGIGILCVFPIFWTIDNIITLRQNLVYFPKDVYPHNWNIISDILENFFGNENYQILQNNHGIYRDLVFNLKNPVYLIFTFFPVLVGIFGLIFSTVQKNRRLYLFFAPSVLFLIFLLILSQNQLAAILTRYLNIVFPVFGICFCFGISSFKNKIISYSVFCFFIFLNLFGLIFSEHNVLNMQRFENRPMRYSMEFDIKPESSDLILIPVAGDRFLYYIKKGKYIPFSVDGAYVLKDRKSTEFYLGSDYKKYNYHNIKDELILDYIYDIPNKPYENNLYHKYLKTMKKGERVIFVSFFSAFLDSAQRKGITLNNYRNFDNAGFLFSKTVRDSYLILNKYLRKTYEYHAPNSLSIYLFEK